LNWGGMTDFVASLDTMTTFIDPRTNPRPPAVAAREPTDDVAEIDELIKLCKSGDVYAVECDSRALVLLLLCNGYDLELEQESPLNFALQCRRWDMVDLLLEWGADPHIVSLEDLFGSYRRELFEGFRDLGVDLCADHALAEAVGARPIAGRLRRTLLCH
jgi:hypothetical protein